MKSVLFLGTSSGTPTKTRSVTSHALIFNNNSAILLDCGEGTQHQILKSTLKRSKVEAVLITHLHGDHLFGLPGLMASLSLVIGNRKKPIIIAGPVGLKTYLTTSFETSETFITYPYKVIELKQEVKNLGLINGVNVTAVPLKHKVACVGYVLTEKDKPGALDVKRAKELGVKPGKAFGILKSGKDITLDNGTIVKSSDVIGQPIKGKKVVLLGDTADSSQIVELAKGCDLVVHEVTYDASMQKKALEGGHSTSTMAGEFAKLIQAKKMIITHFSMRYTAGTDEGLTVDDLLKETQQACDGTKVVAADDLQSFPV